MRCRSLGRASVDDEQGRTNAGAGAMRVRVVRDLVAHTRGQPEEPAIRQLGLQSAGDAKQNVTLVTPMIGSVARRVLDQPHANRPKLPRSPTCHAGLARVLDGVDLLPVSDPKGDVA